jgi:hypothetical protein
MSYEHRSDHERLWSYGYLKFKMIWTLSRTSGSSMRLAASKIRWHGSSRCVHTRCFFENQAEWSPATTVANSETPSRFIVKCGSAPSRSKHICHHVLCLFKFSWIYIHSSVTVFNRTHVRMTFLTGNDVRNKILKNWHEVTRHSKQKQATHWCLERDSKLLTGSGRSVYIYRLRLLLVQVPNGAICTVL